MPIPTDTFWNIKRLNLVFAASALLLLAVTGWSILQDYDQGWRQPQREGQVWQAALVDEKIERDQTPEREAELAELKAKRDALEKELGPDTPGTQKLAAVVRQLTSDQANMEFALNTLKSQVTVKESQLQDAVTAGNQREIRSLTESLKEPRAQLDRDTEALFNKKQELDRAKKELADHTEPLDRVNKQITKLQADLEAQRKKRAALQPKGLFPTVSQFVRRTPLLQFINPPEKVQQVVLPDVLTSLGGVKNVETIDRCATCHVNIANKDFAEPRLLEYLEEQIATSRAYRLPTDPPTSSSAPAATKARPGAVAMPEFWHLYATKLAPEIVRKPASLNRISTLAKTVGAQAKVTIGGKPLASFSYVPDVAKKDDAASAALDPQTRDDVVAALLKAYIGVGSKSPAVQGHVTVTLPDNADEKSVAAPRTVAMKYVEDLKPALVAALPADALHLLNDRYRRAMIAEANKARRREGLGELDPSPVMLAHPRLDLYVDADSKHPMEVVGCTSCHDGSGQETNFVVAAHSPRPIWVDEKTGEPVLPLQIKPQSIREEHHGEDLSDMLAAVWPRGAVVPSRASDIHLTPASSHEPGPAEVASAEAGTPATQPSTRPAGGERPAAQLREVPPAPTDVQTAEDTLPVQYVDPLTGQTRRAVPQMRQWAEKYEPSAPRGFALVYHEWDWPMRPPQYLQANCVRCHADVNDIRSEAPQVFEGRSLFINNGCVNCHQMDSIPADAAPKDPSDIRLIVANGQRKVGTDLRNVTAKLSPAYINTWIWAPKAFRPSTKMPHFFMLENNSSDEEIRRTRQEARSITEYLVRTANQYPQLDPSGQPVIGKDGQPVAGPMPPEFVIPAGAKGSAEAGRAIFTNIGCQGCHTNTNEDAGEKRNGKPVTLAEKWIVTDLVKGGELAKQMEAEAGKAPDAKALSARAAELYDRMTYNERQLYLTEHLAPQYSGVAPKYADGTPKPLFQHHGPELSGIGTKLTAGGRTVDQARAWLYDWVSNPRHYSEYTVMPRLRLSPQQALDLTEYLLAQKRTNDKPDDPWKADLTPPDTQKLIELTAQFLRSRYSPQVANLKADDIEELKALATDALTTVRRPADAAKAEVEQILKSGAAGSGGATTQPVAVASTEAVPATAPATAPANASGAPPAAAKDTLRMVFLGKKLIGNYGCMSCHAINGAENLTSPCANLSDWGQKGIDKLDFGYLDHHKVEHLPPTRPIPMVNGLSAKAALLTSADYRADFSDGKVASPVTAAWPHVDHSRTSWLTQKLKNTRVYDRGQEMKDPEPGSDDPVRAAGKPYDKLKMPTFYLSDREVDALVTWVISNRESLISHKLASKTVNERAERIARGRQVVQKFNCVGCHVIDGNAPPVQQYYRADELTTRAPPSLRGEGNKIQHAWLFNFLKNVEPLRPLLYKQPENKPGIRMPSFPITDEEASEVAAYFAAESNHESDALKQQLAVVRKYIDTQQELALKPVAAPKSPTTVPTAEVKPLVENLIKHAGGQIAAHDFKGATETLTTANTFATAAKLTEQVGPTTKPVSARLKDSIDALKDYRVPDGIAWPGDDWSVATAHPEFATQTDALRRWALDNKQINDLQVDPTKNKPAELAKNYRTILYKASFVRELYDAPYPFVDAPRPELSDEQFKKGEALFYEMQCLKCHVLGDPNVAGAQKNPTAPNLGLAYRRLQRRWVRHWVQEPAIIQIGTSMPPFFTGLGVFDLSGVPWPRSQGAPPAECERVEKIYGKTADAEANLLLDFVYAAGVRGYTGIQPTGGAATPPTPVVQERNPAKGQPQTAPPTSTQPLLPGNAAKNTAAEPPGAPSPKATEQAAPKAQQETVSPKVQEEKPKPTPKKEGTKPAESAKTQASGGDTGGASVVGKVVLEGKAPEMKEIDMSGVKECAAQHADPVQEQTVVADDKGNLANVVVYVSSGLPQQNYDPPAEPAVLDQKGCMYHPHVLPVMVGQKMLIKNSDTFLHNVHALANTNPAFNFGQPNADDGKPVEPLKAAETFRVKCDVHPWMSAYVVGLENPFFGVSGEDGSFSIKNLPPGDYTLTAWHESLGTKEIPVKVEAGKPAKVEVKFAAP